MLDKKMTQKIILLGLDGGTWSQFDYYLKEGLMPNLELIIKNGTRGNFKSFFPFTSKASWISILTGTNAGKHGVPHHGVHEKQEVPSIWKILSENKFQSIVVHDLVTYPPLQINGMMITGGYATPPSAKNFVHPSSMLQEINKISNGYIPSLGSNTFEKLKNDLVSEAFQERIDYDEKIIQTSLSLGKNHGWDVLSVTLENPDAFHHVFWDKPDRLKEFYIWLDGKLGQFYDLAKSNNASIIIISDHGCGPIKKHFLVNTWLRKSGFTKFGELSSVRKKLAKTKFKRSYVRNTLSKIKARNIASKITPQKLKMMIPLEEDETGFIDETSSEVFSEAYNSIKINVKDPARRRVLVKEIIEKLLEIEDNGEKIIEEVYAREDVFDGPYVERAADIQFLLKEGYRWTSHIRDSHYLLEPKDFDLIRSGDHRPEGIIIAAGPEIAISKRLTSSPILWDISPTILHMLNIPIPSYMDGSPIKEIFNTDSENFKKEVIISDLHSSDTSIDDSTSYSKEEEAEIEKTLKDMGYL